MALQCRWLVQSSALYLRYYYRVQCVALYPALPVLCLSTVQVVPGACLGRPSMAPSWPYGPGTVGTCAYGTWAIWPGSLRYGPKWDPIWGSWNSGITTVPPLYGPQIGSQRAPYLEVLWRVLWTLPRPYGPRGLALVPGPLGPYGLGALALVPRAPRAMALCTAPVQYTIG